MRLARLEDHKRRVREKATLWPLQLRRLAFADLPSLGTAEVALTSPFTIFSGPNGVGKTTVLRALWAAADPSTARPSPGGSLKITTGSATLDYLWNGDPYSSQVTFLAGKPVGGTPMPVNVIHLDVSSGPLRYQEEFCAFFNSDEITNGFGGNKVDDKALDEINYICKRDYKEIIIYEIEDGENLVPFFEVSYDGDRYDSRTMGSGEITILHTWWTVNQAAESSLLLIEEPETFLSPACQEAMAHFLLASTVERKLVTVMTSHSAKIVDSLADDHRIFIYRESGLAKFAEAPISPSLLKTVGVDAKINIVILVEDEAAQIFLKLILERFDPSLSRTCEISNRKGDGNIKAVLERIGSDFKQVKIVGVFDGDMRNKLKKTVYPVSGFLPGDIPIELILKEFINNNILEVSEALSFPKLSEILFELQGANHHDWYEGLCSGLGLAKSQLFPMLFNVWIKKPENEEAAIMSIASLKAALGAKGDNGA